MAAENIDRFTPGSGHPTQTPPAVWFHYDENILALLGTTSHDIQDSLQSWTVGVDSSLEVPLELRRINFIGVRDTIPTHRLCTW
jgi:hypothetical protein